MKNAGGFSTSLSIVSTIAVAGTISMVTAGQVSNPRGFRWETDPNRFQYNGQHIQMTNIPFEYFSTQQGMTPDETARLIEIQYDILSKAHGYDKPITILYSEDNCGAYADARQSRVTLCQGFAAKNVENNMFPFMVTAHEIDHVMEAGRSGAALHLFEHGYSAYLDEHQAEVNPELVARRMLEHQQEYGISDGAAQQIRRTNEINREIQERAYNRYVAEGKNFDIRQEHIEAATVTGQATSYEIFKLTDKYGVEAIEKFDRALKDEPLLGSGLVRRGLNGNFESDATPEQVATYVVAAWSVAFDLDLRQQFRDDLNYPINDELFEQYRRILVEAEADPAVEAASVGMGDTAGNSEGTTPTNGLAGDFTLPISGDSTPPEDSSGGEAPADEPPADQPPAEEPPTANQPPAEESF